MSGLLKMPGTAPTKIRTNGPVHLAGLINWMVLLDNLHIVYSQMERSQMGRREIPLCEMLPGNAVDHLPPVTANLDQVLNLTKHLTHFMSM
mgnify:CR=1 FL=1